MKVYFTFDDGHPDDFKLIKLFEKYKIPLMLFIPRYNNENKVISKDDLALYLSISDLMFSPGNVGLNAIQSPILSTPVCTHNNILNQMPDFECISNLENGILFKEDSIDDLVEKIKY
jgi:glycosyltransferase involved in cell wall biosynthesis